MENLKGDPVADREIYALFEKLKKEKRKKRNIKIAIFCLMTGVLIFLLYFDIFQKVYTQTIQDAEEATAMHTNEEVMKKKEEYERLEAIFEPLLIDVEEGIGNVLDYAIIAAENPNEMKEDGWHLGMVASAMILSEASESLLKLDVESSDASIQGVQSRLHDIGKTLSDVEPMLLEGLNESDESQLDEVLKRLETASEQKIDMEEFVKQEIHNR